MNMSYLSNNNPETNTEFATRWANNWKENLKRVEKLNDMMVYGNLRGSVINTQKQFERHLHNLMNHRSHQQEF